MKIKWNGHACFTITADNGAVIVTDPYDPAAYGGVLAYDMVKDRTDIALVSHDHLDHNHVSGLTGSPVVLRKSGKAKGLEIKGLEVCHDETGGKERGANTIFSFAVDGIRICFTGDLGHRLSADQIRSVGPVDVLLIPVGGTFTLDAKGAVDVAKSLNARLIIPMHFKTEKCQLPISSAESFLELMPNVKRKNQSEINLSLETIPAKDTEVWVLAHAC
jgi:L-ascorbate metabolism protein UlaG (beta-lactamase superfamily)